MIEGGKILARIMRELEKMVRPGISTKYLNGLAESLVLKFGGKCSFKNFEGYPACLCTSINNEIVHGVPSNRILKKEDVLSLDIGIFDKNFHSDMAITIPVGGENFLAKTNPEALKLIRVTEKALKLGIKEVRVGGYFGDIGNKIQQYIENQGFNVIKELCGHGIGKNLHEDPQILNYGKRGSGLKIEEGMTFCIEPMATIGDWRIQKGPDGFSYQTKDGSISAHFEHTLAVIEKKCVILTAAD